MAMIPINQFAAARFVADVRTHLHDNPLLVNSLNAALAGGGTIVEWLKNPDVQKQLLRTAGIGAFCAVAASGPFVVAGFGAAGPTAGTLAPWIQSALYGGATPAGGWFAAATSAGMTGVLGTIQAATAATAGVGGAAWNFRRARRS